MSTSSLMSTLTQVSQALERVGIKAPWKYTGAWLNPDYEHFLPTGDYYRKVAPGSQLLKAKVPHDHPSLVYDIKYFVRDHRRNNKWAARSVDASGFDFNKMFEGAPLTPDQVKHVATPAMMPTRGF